MIELFPKEEFDYELRESPKFAKIVFPVIDKGRKDKEHWPEIREKLTTIASKIYYKIQESGL